MLYMYILNTCTNTHIHNSPPSTINDPDSTAKAYSMIHEYIIMCVQIHFCQERIPGNQEPATWANISSTNILHTVRHRPLRYTKTLPYCNW